jgi:hypothetical protein
MAALRHRIFRVITPEESRKHEKWLKAGLKKKRHQGYARKLPGRAVQMWEVVATTPAEAASGLFQPVGNLMVFIPEQVEDKLWERIRLMDRPEHAEVWKNKYWGIRTALKQMGMFIEHEVAQFPVGLLDVEKHVIVPAEVDPITHQERAPQQMVKVRQYEAFIRDVWFPKWLYSSRLAQQGKFKDTKRAQAVASAFGLDVDTLARKQDWFTTGTPDVLAEAERNIILPEETFQDIKQSWISMMESRHAKGLPIQIDWDMALEQYRGGYGVKAKQIIDRLRIELEPIMAQIRAGTWRFEHNRSRAYRPTRAR